MISIPKMAGIVSCSALLCLGLSNVASAADESAKNPSVKMVSDSIGDSKPGKTIKGEIIRVDGDSYYFVKQEDGKEVRMHVDSTTEQRSTQKGKPGDHVIAKVDDKGHAISFLTDQPIAH